MECGTLIRNFFMKLMRCEERTNASFVLIRLCAEVPIALYAKILKSPCRLVKSLYENMYYYYCLDNKVFGTDSSLYQTKNKTTRLY